MIPKPAWIQLHVPSYLRLNHLPITQNQYILLYVNKRERKVLTFYCKQKKFYNKGSKTGLLTLYSTLKDVFHFMIHVSNSDILIIVNFTALVLRQDAIYDLN